MTDIRMHSNDADPAGGANARTKRGDAIHPLVLLLAILAVVTLLTYVVPSGSYAREGRLVVPGSFEVLDKAQGWEAFFAATGNGPAGEASPVGLAGMLMAIPAGLERGAGLIFMVLVIGGMFGILSDSGAIARGLDRLLGAVRGNIYILAASLIVVLSAGSTFLGLASEYLIVIPVVVTLANRFGMTNLMGLAIVTVATKIGYLASVTNPLPLTVAQPLLGLPIFSGALLRLAFYLVFLLVGIAFMMAMIRRARPSPGTATMHSAARLSRRHLSMLAILALGIGALVVGSSRWHWDHVAFSAFYIGLSIVLAGISGLGANKAAAAFVGGMKNVLMASFLIGIATAISIVLEEGLILDTFVHALTALVDGGGPVLAVHGMFVSQLLLDFLIPSTSGQAAVSMPILAPMGQIAGVGEQATLLAFLFGNSLTNMITPTSGTLLAYLATARVNWLDWARFILPLWLVFAAISLGLLALTVLFELG